MRCRNLTQNNSIVFCNSAGLINVERIDIIANDTVQVSFNTLQMTSDFVSPAETYSDMTVLDMYVSCSKTKTNRLSFVFTSSYNVTVRYLFEDTTTNSIEFNSGENVIVDEVWPCSKIQSTNYVVEQDYVRCALTQKLSILKGELWFSSRYGLPLFDKVSSKGVFDAYVSSILQKQKNVLEVLSFNSTIQNHHYITEFKLLTSFGELAFSTIR